MKFCSYCGKQLADGEVCSCPKSAQARRASAAASGQTERNYGQIPIDKEKVSAAIGKVSKFVEDANRSQESPLVSGVGGYFERDMPIVDECVVATEEEIPVRQYNIAKLRTLLVKKAEGRLQVTNKRVIFRAAGKSLTGPIIIENEFALEEIGGIEIKTDYRFNPLLALLSFLAAVATAFVMCWLVGSLSRNARFLAKLIAILLIIFTIAFHVLLKKRFLLKNMATLSCAAVCFISSMAFYGSGPAWRVLMVPFAILAIWTWVMSAMTNDLRIIVKIKGAHDAIEIGCRSVHEKSTGFSEVIPWTDTNVAIRELGALIDDVKRYGNAGIEKWKQ